MNITISSSKNDFLVFQLVTFPLLDDDIIENVDRWFITFYM